MVERLDAKNEAEGEARQRTLIEKALIDGGEVSTVTAGWACQCGEEIGPGPTLMKCVGCDGMTVGKVKPKETAAREERLRETTLAWT